MECLFDALLVQNVRDNQEEKRRVVSLHFDTAMYYLHHEMHHGYTHILFVRQHVLQQLFLLNESVELNHEVERDSTKIQKDVEIILDRIYFFYLPMMINPEISYFSLFLLEIILHISNRMKGESENKINTIFVYRMTQPQASFTQSNEYRAILFVD